MTTRVLISALLATVLLGCVGCGSIDPYRQAGTWRPRHVNDGNLAAMVADPTQLVQGREATSSDGVLAAAAIERLHHDRLKPLAGTDFHVGGGGASQPQGGDTSASLTGGVN